VDTITGCWEGALVPEHGGITTSFALIQPAHELRPAAGITLSLAGGASIPARLLEGAPRSMVALADDAQDPESGGVAQLLLEGRVLGDMLVGHWMRRDVSGRVLSSGHLTASRSH
jgi:hypothetical protein